MLFNLRIGVASCIPSIWSSTRVEIGNTHVYGVRLVSCLGPSVNGCSCYWITRRYMHCYSQPSSKYSVLQSSSLQHWFKNWQDKRKNKLTASTFAGAIGLFPRRRVQLWLEKLGAIEPFRGNLATCWNNVKEEEALERYKLITGNTVLFPEFMVHDKNPEDNWLAASPDGAVESLVYESPSRGVLEIKCPFIEDMSQVRPWKRIPLYYMPQAQGLMEIMDRDWMDFYVWTPKGSSLFRVYRDEEYWALIKTALSDFWWNHVQPAKEICNESVITNPLAQLRSLRPKPRHDLCPSIVCHSKIGTVLHPWLHYLSPRRCQRVWLEGVESLEAREDISLLDFNSKRGHARSCKRNSLL